MELFKFNNNDYKNVACLVTKEQFDYYKKQLDYYKIKKWEIKKYKGRSPFCNKDLNFEHMLFHGVPLSWDEKIISRFKIIDFRSLGNSIENWLHYFIYGII